MEIIRDSTLRKTVGEFPVFLSDKAWTGTKTLHVGDCAFLIHQSFITVCLLYVSATPSRRMKVVFFNSMWLCVSILWAMFPNMNYHIFNRKILAPESQLKKSKAQQKNTEQFAIERAARKTVCWSYYYCDVSRVFDERKEFLFLKDCHWVNLFEILERRL